MPDGFSYTLSRSARSRRRRLITHSDAYVDLPTAFPEDAVEASVPDEPALAVETAPVVDVPQMRVVPPPGQRDLREIARLLHSAHPVTWVFTGDSVVHGARHTAGRRSFTEHFAERTRWELRRSSDVVINTGAVGGRACELLRSLQGQVLRFRPDVVSVLFGLDDAAAGRQGRDAFREQITGIVKRLRDEGVLLVLNTPNRILADHSAAYADVRGYVRIIRETAVDFDVPCVDHWAHWKRAGDEQVARWLSPDGLHPNARGHRELARQLFEFLDIFDETSPTCRN